MDVRWIRSWPVGTVLRNNKKKQINMSTALEMFYGSNPPLTQILHTPLRNKFRAKYRNRHMEVRPSCFLSTFFFLSLRGFRVLFDGAMEDTRGQAVHGFQMRLKNPQECFAIVCTVPYTSRMSLQARLRVFLSHSGTQVEHSLFFTL